MEIKQYQIVLVNLDPSVGSEIQKTRPCVVISPDEMNRNIQTVVIAPMTTVQKKWPTRVSVRHDQKKGWIAIDQIRTVDKQRIVQALGNLTYSEIQETKRVMRETYVD